MSEELNLIIEQLRDANPEARVRAVALLAEISRAGLSYEDGRHSLQAAQENWPKDRKVDPSRELVAAALVEVHPEYMELIVEGFPRFSEMSRWRTVQRLAQLHDEFAASTYVALVEKYGASGLVPGASIERFADAPQVVKWLCPKLLALAGPSVPGAQIHLLALRAAQKGFLAAADLAAFSGIVVQMYEPMRRRMRNLEKPTGDDWIWCDGYLGERAHANLLLDQMGYLPGDAVIGTLEETIASRDPRIKLFAALSMLRHRAEPPASEFEAIAASAEVRNWLHDGLEKLGRLDLFPARFASQEALAESNMVDWLVYPTELGRTPHEIELMDTFDDNTAKERFYLFRFRTHAPHWAAKKGWMAGLAGPFEVSGTPHTKAGGFTFSSCTKWDEKTPQEHFEAISGLIAGHWKQRAAAMGGSKER